MQTTILRNHIPEAPKGTIALKWYGPGLLWMLSAVGTGSILFTPRVAAIYQYQLLWVLLLVVFFMWVMIREMARYSIVTGETILQGMHRLPGPEGWAVWLLFLPQLLAASVGIAGLSAVIGSALGAFFPGQNAVYSILIIVLCTLFTVTGHYLRIEKFSRIMALLLMTVTIISAVVVAPSLEKIVEGLLISYPDQPDYYVILPWVGTILAGSMGIVWFGYWTASRGYGGGVNDTEMKSKSSVEPREENADIRIERAKKWISVMSGAATIGVLGGLTVIIAFLVLGSELLAPRELIPQGTDVAIDLANLFTNIWGTTGKYLLLLSIVIALGGSVLANQDGWGRSFADMSMILIDRKTSKHSTVIDNILQWLTHRTSLLTHKRRTLKRIYIFTITGVIPIAIVLTFKDPVRVMSASGIIAAAHTPFIVFTALWVNRRQLPKPLRPGLPIASCMVAAGLFYLGFAVLYFTRL